MKAKQSNHRGRILQAFSNSNWNVNDYIAFHSYLKRPSEILLKIKYQLNNKDNNNVF